MAAADGVTSESGEAGEAGEVSGDSAPAEVADGPRPEVAPPEVAPDVPMLPDVQPDLPVDRPVTGQPNGAPCKVNSNCRTNSCVEEVCCDSACTGGCSSCLKNKTTRPDGTCAADTTRERMECGTYCAQIGANVPAVLKRVCTAGQCVPAATIMIQEICQKDDRCTSSFCDQPNPMTAKCIHTVCPTAGTCCCGPAAGMRMCVQRAQCTGDRSCS